MTDRPATLEDVQRLEDKMDKRIDECEREIADLKTAQATTHIKYIFLSAVGSSIPVLLSIAIYLFTRR